jgi:hypothetical protein
LTVGGQLVLLAEQPYEKEEVLQRALAEHPEVIAGPTTKSGGGGKLLLVRREMGVPGDVDGPAVWSVDHLFLDADGVPVIVETKRSSDTRIRREVVGQMLDYAANVTKYWPLERLQAAVAKSAADTNRTSEELIAELRAGIDVEEYWKNVQANLSSGRIRMVFVADSLPPELIRVIEFLNEQMSPAEVLGVEVHQFVGGDHVAYVPQVIGRTTRAIDTKAAGGGGQVWDEGTFLEAAERRRPEPEAALIRQLLDDVRVRGDRLGFGKGATPGVSGWYEVAGQVSPVWNLNVNSEGSPTGSYLYVYLSDLAKKLPSEVIEQAATTLATIPAMAPKIAEARAAAWNKYPSVFLASIASDAGDVRALFDAIRTLTAANRGT